MNQYRKQPEGHNHDRSIQIGSELQQWIADIERLQREKGFIGFPAPPEHLADEWHRTRHLYDEQEHDR